MRPPFGLSTRVWAFIKVFLAASLVCLAFYGTAKHILEWQSAAWGVADRLALVVKSAVFAVLPALIGIAVVAAQRLNPDNFSGAQVKRDSMLDINARFIQNTFEQCLLFLVGIGALAVYVKPADATAVPVLATMFLAGRALLVGLPPQHLCALIRFWRNVLPDGRGFRVGGDPHGYGALYPDLTTVRLMQR